MCPPPEAPPVQNPRLIFDDPVTYFLIALAEFGLPEIGDFNHELEIDIYIITFEGVEINMYTNWEVMFLYLGI